MAAHPAALAAFASLPRYYGTMSSVDSCLSLLHRRQFVIAREPHLVGTGWNTFLLAHGLTLSASPEASVGTAIDRGGGAWTLLGNAFQAVPERPAPLDEIASLGTEAVLEGGNCFVSWQRRGSRRRHFPRPMPT